MDMLHKYLPRISAALCGGCLLLLLIDLVFPNIYLFLQGWVKLYLLIACLAAAGAAILLASRQRAGMRTSRRRR